jgi:sialate O-acetylesterase
MMNAKRAVAAFFVIAPVVSSVKAELKLASVFTDGIVVQQGIELPIWGTATAGTSVEVRFAGQSVSAEAGQGGNWRAKLKPCSANATGTQLHVVDSQTNLTVQDVLVGEVWLAAGQSNMQMTVQSMVGKLPQLQQWVDKAKQPTIRFLRINEPVAGGRRTDFGSPVSWPACDPESAKHFSAVSWIFARRLQQKLDVPVGIIDVSWGGKPIEPFIPGEAFEQHPLLQEIKRLADENQLKELAELEGGVIIRNPEGYPGAIYDARIRPLEGFGLRGFLWYQAESNCGNGEDPRGYRHKMQTLTNSWRDAWNNPDLPLYFVQLPNYRPETFGWIRMREEQRRSLTTKNTAMVVAIDTGSDDIHPANKVDVGERLAELALNRNDGRHIVDSGPLYEQHTVVGDEVTVRFLFAESGLMLAEKNELEQPQPADGAQTVPYFELAGADGLWYPAEAKISGRTVKVISEHVPEPQEVRYCCRNDPTGALLYNRAGLPASPFCSKLEWLPWHREAGE